jgi:hypothetical protein
MNGVFGWAEPDSIVCDRRAFQLTTSLRMERKAEIEIVESGEAAPEDDVDGR